MSNSFSENQFVDVTRKVDSVKELKVATFWHAEEGRRPFVTAYLRDYNPAWPGCVMYEVIAETGLAAKRLAEKMRRERETTAR